MYVVIEMFDDIQDELHRYEVGDSYPREGLEPSPERIAELAGDTNVRKRPLIKAVKSTPVKKPAAKKTAKKG